MNDCDASQRERTLTAESLIIFREEITNMNNETNKATAAAAVCFVRPPKEDVWLDTKRPRIEYMEDDEGIWLHF